MIFSMTGFGRGEAVDPSGGRFAVELSAVNRKQLELRFNLPREFSAQEAMLRRILGEKLRRGSVNCRVIYSAGASRSDCRVNKALLNVLVSECESRGAAWSLSELMLVPGVVESSDSGLETPETLAALEKATVQALENLLSMRRDEGVALERDFRGRLAVLEELLSAIEPQAAAVKDDLKRRLLERLASEKLPCASDDERMLRELLFYTDRCDVTEEITRLRSHFGQFRKFLAAPEGDSGRSLDFLMQEFFREITTLGNKAGNSGISPLTVRFKSELEKLREQIQNVE